MTIRKPISATVTIQPLTLEQQKWGLKGAVEALDLILKGEVNKESVENLREQVKNQLESLDKN